MLNINDFEVIGPDKLGKYSLKWNEMIIHLYPDHFKNKTLPQAIEFLVDRISKAENMRKREVASKLLCEKMEPLLQEPGGDTPDPVC